MKNSLIKSSFIGSSVSIDMAVILRQVYHGVR